MAVRVTPDKMSFGNPHISREDFFNQVLGNRGNFSQNTQPQNILNTIELEEKTIFIFDFSGEKVTSVEAKDDSMVNDYGETMYDRQNLTIRFEDKEPAAYILPRGKINHTFIHGILEVSLKK